jgi:hypothetical protein
MKLIKAFSDILYVDSSQPYFEAFL